MWFYGFKPLKINALGLLLLKLKNVEKFNHIQRKALKTKHTNPHFFLFKVLPTFFINIYPEGDLNLQAFN